MMLRIRAPWARALTLHVQHSTRTAYIAPYLSLACLPSLPIYLILGEACFEKSWHRHHSCPRVGGTEYAHLRGTLWIAVNSKWWDLRIFLVKRTVYTHVLFIFYWYGIHIYIFLSMMYGILPYQDVLTHVHNCILV